MTDEKFQMGERYVLSTMEIQEMTCKTCGKTIKVLSPTPNKIAKYQERHANECPSDEKSCCG